MAEFKKYLQEQEIFASGYSKASLNLVGIASVVEKMVLPVDPNFEKDDANALNESVIHDTLIPNPFLLKTVNNINASPPFGLCDIFNYLIYHSTGYDKQGLAVYRSFGDYRLFDDGYVKSLLTSHLNSRGNSCICSQCAPFYGNKNGRGKGTLRPLVYC